MGEDIVNSQDIKTLILLLQIKQNNQGVDLSNLISICTRYGYILEQ